MQTTRVLIFLLLITTAVLISGCIQENKQDKNFERNIVDTNGTNTKNVTTENQKKSMTFEVKIPKNTNEEDTVWIYVKQKPYKMKKISNYAYNTTPTKCKQCDIDIQEMGTTLKQQSI